MQNVVEIYCEKYRFEKNTLLLPVYERKPKRVTICLLTGNKQINLVFRN